MSANEDNFHLDMKQKIDVDLDEGQSNCEEQQKRQTMKKIEWEIYSCS